MKNNNDIGNMIKYLINIKVDNNLHLDIMDELWFNNSAIDMNDMRDRVRSKYGKEVDNQIYREIRQSVSRIIYSQCYILIREEMMNEK